MALLGATAWGLPWLLASWSMNMFLFMIWPWLLSGPIFFAAHGGNAGPVSRSRSLASMAVCGLCFLLVAVHWWVVVPRGTQDGRAVATWLFWLMLAGGLLVAALQAIAQATRNRTALAVAEAVLISWLFGPAVPWAGEAP